MNGIDFRKSIGDAIKELQVSIALVARRAECSHQTLYNYLSGKTNAIHTDILERVLNVLQEMKDEKQKTFIRLPKGDKL